MGKKNFLVDELRKYILTELDRRRLLDWLETGEETQGERDLFTDMRDGFPQLVKDMKLLIRVRRQLQTQCRWRGKPRQPPGFRSSLRRGESG